MDDRRFDNLARVFGGTRSRRQVLRALAGTVAAALLPSSSHAAACSKEGEACGCCRGNLTCASGVCCHRERVCGAACCPAGYKCSNGQCVRNGNGSAGGCPSGQAKCGQTCVDISSDVANCGACGRVCPASTDPCKVAVCQAGVCGFSAGNEGASCNDGNKCMQGDTCRGGVCTGGTQVVCTALDQCHDVGTCDPATGQCTNPDKLDGTPCNDGNACKVNDTCQGGVCTGGDPVVCLNFNPCVSAYCDPAVGCTSTPTAAGTPCPDLARCDGSEVCDGHGNCVDGTPVTCDECNACDPRTGVCAPTNEGGSCTGDGNRCFGAFACRGGSCVGEQPVVCGAPDQCHDQGTCDPTTGICSNPNKADGVTCDAGTECPSNDTCQSGVCVAAPCIICTPNETRHCYTGPAGTENVGICRGGTQTCSADGTSWGTCVGQVTPQGTVCNGLDNNCDGIQDDGFICTPGFYCIFGQCEPYTPGCFAAGALVTMADGSTKAIEDVRAGDLVRGRNGAANPVTEVQTPRLGKRSLYSVNDGSFLVTSSHPFHTPSGLKSLDPDATVREPRGLSVGRLSVGDELLGEWNERHTGPDGGHPRLTIQTLAARNLPPETPLYNLLVGGDGTHTIGGVLFEEK